MPQEVMRTSGSESGGLPHGERTSESLVVEECQAFRAKGGLDAGRQEGGGGALPTVGGGKRVEEGLAAVRECDANHGIERVRVDTAGVGGREEIEADDSAVDFRSGTELLRPDTELDRGDGA